MYVGNETGNMAYSKNYICVRLEDLKKTMT
jgi:hypothetical protein